MITNIIITKTVNNRNEKLDNYYVESYKSKWKLYFIKTNDKGTAFSSYDKIRN